MTIIDVAPYLAILGFLGFAVPHARGAFRSPPGLWMAPAALSALFFLWSLAAVVVEGPLGFWTEHTRNLWGVQIWFDLLLAVAIGWWMAVPRARALGMRPTLWLCAVLSTGCIGFLAMVARMLYLEAASERAA